MGTTRAADIQTRIGVRFVHCGRGEGGTDVGFEGMIIGSIKVSSSGRVAVIALNRPDVLNALNTSAWLELERAVAAVHTDDTVHVCVITGGSGRAFSAGADINELHGRTLDSLIQHAERVRRILALIEGSPKPFIASINGLAVGGGAEIALACHLRIAAEEAWFSFPEVALGLIPGAGGTQRLARLIGKGRAMELVLTGRRLSAVEALDWGLLNHVTTANELSREAERLAERAAGPRRATALAISALNVAYEADLNTGTVFETAMLAVGFCQRAAGGMDGSPGDVS